MCCRCVDRLQCVIPLPYPPPPRAFDAGVAIGVRDMGLWGQRGRTPGLITVDFGGLRRSWLDPLRLAGLEGGSGTQIRPYPATLDAVFATFGPILFSQVLVDTQMGVSRCGLTRLGGWDRMRCCWPCALLHGPSSGAMQRDVLGRPATNKDPPSPWTQIL